MPYQVHLSCVMQVSHKVISPLFVPALAAQLIITASGMIGQKIVLLFERYSVFRLACSARVF